VRHLLHNPLERSIVETAERQWGLLRRGQLLDLGLGADAIRHRVRSGRLHVLHPGVYALGHRAISRKAEYLAAVWWVGGDAALSDVSACAFRGWLEEDYDHPGPVHVTTTKARRSRPGVVVHRTRRLPATDVLTYERLLRVTDEARTLVDRADRGSYRELRLLADRLRRLPTRRLQQCQEALPGRAGHSRIARLVTSRDARTRSVLERRLTAYLDHYGLPQPDARNELVAGCQADAVYVEERLALELDSRAHHQRVAEMREDKRRDRRYRRAGFTPMRIVWEELAPEDPELADELRERLGPRSG
jgi:very-short-patch-repair endonuclease